VAVFQSTSTEHASGWWLARCRNMSRNGTSIILHFYTFILKIIAMKLATKQKLRGVSAYLPDSEVLCSEHVGTFWAKIGQIRPFSLV